MDTILMLLFSHRFCAHREVKERAKSAKKSSTVRPAGAGASIPKNQKFAAGTKGGRR